MVVIFVFTIIIFSICQPVYAVTEEEVQAQVDAEGKETVVGNVLIWFLCAVGFLKISQKIDSFMSSLGINVGNTGGSLLAEAVIAARGFGTVRDFSGLRGSSHAGGGSTSGSSEGWFLSGGLAGIVSRNIKKGAVEASTAPENESGSQFIGGIGGHAYTSSVAKGGAFANSIIGSVATGNMNTMGSITGEKAVEALNSYMGYTAMEDKSQVPTFSNVEIGGGRITGKETNARYPKGIEFAMYHTGQYTAPDGDYTTVYTADGTSWYKQYAQDTLERIPYIGADGMADHVDTIVKKMPPVPRRKDKL